MTSNGGLTIGSFISRSVLSGNAYLHPSPIEHRENSIYSWSVRLFMLSIVARVIMIQSFGGTDDA